MTTNNPEQIKALEVTQDLPERLRDYRSYDDLARSVHHDICREAAAEIEALRERVREDIEWAREQSQLHHRLAHENPDLRREHIASSTAYRELAEKLAARQSLNKGS